MLLPDQQIYVAADTTVVHKNICHYVGLKSDIIAESEIAWFYSVIYLK